tara:strand:- start:483 stop:728 length:246 start_codon:yes stop_codon:yes gene_type:complete
MKQLFFSMALVFGLFFIGLPKAYAISNPLSFPPEETSSSLDSEVVLEPSSSDSGIDVENDEISMEDLFGSEQVFPFEPGFS